MERTITAPKMLTLAGTVLAVAAPVAVFVSLGAPRSNAASVPAPSGAVFGADPQHTQPEGCAADADPVVDSGRIALFDVYWDSAAERLTNNPCPPTLTYVPASGGGRTGLPEVPAHETRAASDINIKNTIIHVPSSYKHTLSASSTTDQEKYPFLFVNGAFISDHVWVLPTCDPDYHTTADADDLCVAFSAALLNTSDWLATSESIDSDLGDVQFEFEHEEELGISPADEGEVFVFYPHDDIPAGLSTDDQVTWRTDNADQNELLVTPDTYEYRQWGFTKPGTYVFSVHAKGHPVSTLSGAKTVTSEVVYYTFHVGLLAELNTNISADVTEPDIGDTVTITVTANNEGPARGDDVWVKVPLPEGLTFFSDSASAGSYDSETGLWLVGDMAEPPSAANPTRATLTITATVDAGTRGKDLAVSAIIGGIETVGGSEVTELDPHNEHHASTVTITPVVRTNVDPMFKVVRSVDENSAAGTHVGEMIMVREPDAGDTLTYAVTGDGAVNFVAVAVPGGVQVQVAATHFLDYEVVQSYDLVLGVSDGLDHEGNADPRVDHRIALLVNVNDVYEPPTYPIAVTLSADGATAPVAGGSGFRFTLRMEYAESYTESNLMFDWVEHDEGGANENISSGSVNLQPSQFFYPLVTPNTPVTRQYQITLWVDDDPETPGRVTVGQSDVVTVEWRRAGG